MARYLFALEWKTQTQNTIATRTYFIVQIIGKMAVKQNGMASNLPKNNMSARCPQGEMRHERQEV